MIASSHSNSVNRFQKDSNRARIEEKITGKYLKNSTVPLSCQLCSNQIYPRGMNEMSRK